MNKKKSLLLIFLLVLSFMPIFVMQISEVVAPTIDFSTDNITSIHICPLDLHTFVMVYSDDTNDDVSFQIYDVNGTQILAETDVDTTAGGTGFTSVGVSAFNSTTFVIGWFDTVDGDATFAVYDSTGTLITGPIDVDTLIDWSYAVSVSAFNSTHFVIAWGDRYDYDVTFAIYDSTGTLLVGPIDADSDVGDSPMSVSVSAFNSTTFVIGWYDYIDEDATFCIYDSSGNNQTNLIDVDTDVGTGYSVSVSCLNSTTFVIGWYDYIDYDATFAVYDSTGTLITGPIDADSAVGTTAYSVQVSALNSTPFVISWYDAVDYDLTFATYLSDGTVVCDATDIESWPTSVNAPFRYQSPCSQESATGIKLYNDYWVIAYANTTNQADWKSYKPDGTIWDGRISVQISTETFTDGLYNYYPCQRRNYYAVGRWWTFYGSNGSMTVYQSSVDTITWSGEQILASFGEIAGGVSVASNGTHFSFAVVNGTYDTHSSVEYNLGTPHSNGTITLIGDWQEVASYNDSIMKANIFLDNDMKPWIFYANESHFSPPMTAYIDHSSYANGTWASQGGLFPYSLPTSTDSCIHVASMVPHTDGTVQWVYCDNNTGNITSYLFNNTHLISTFSWANEIGHSPSFGTFVKITEDRMFLSHYQRLYEISKTALIKQFPSGEPWFYASATSICVDNDVMYFIGGGTTVSTEHDLVYRILDLETDTFRSETHTILSGVIPNLDKAETINVASTKGPDGRFLITYIHINDLHLWAASLIAYELNLKTIDVDGVAIPDAIVYVDSTSLTTSSDGWANFSRVANDAVNISVVFREVYVNDSFTVTVDSDKTIDVACKAYPFTLDGTRYWMAGNATVSSYSWDSSAGKFVLSFSGAVDTYTLVSSATSKPTYILNCSYDLDTDWSSYLTLTHYGNRTLTISYAGWASTFIYRADHIVTNTYWGGDEIVYITLNGTSGQSGTLEVYCGERGIPTSSSGLSDTVYFSGTTIFTGTYTFSSTVTAGIDWTTGGGGGGGGSQIIPIFATAETIDIGPVQQGTSKAFNASATWTGPTTITLSDVEFTGEGSEWLKVDYTFPQTILRLAIETKGIINVPITISVPSNAKLGSYKILVEYSIEVGAGTYETRANILWSVTATPFVPTPITEVVSVILLISLIAVVFLGIKKRR